MDLRPGEIYWAFDSAGGRRPFVVVSRAELNGGKYILAVPFTSARLEQREHLPSCVVFNEGDFGLNKKCVAQADALTQLRKLDLEDPPDYVGTLSLEAQRELIKAIGYAIGAVCEPEPLGPDPSSTPRTVS